MDNCTEPSSQNAGYSVLLAEDNAVNQRIVIKFLENENCTLCVVENGLKAFEKVQEERFDVILMDVAMPIMDGYTATAKIREWQLENGIPRTPILAMIVSTFRRDREKCIAQQMDDIVIKPAKREKLLESVRLYVYGSGATVDAQTEESGS